MTSNYKEERPWGTFENILDRPYTKVKEIIIKPGQAPSYQYHEKRAEIWVIVQGRALVTIEGIKHLKTAKTIVAISTGKKHRIENVGEEDLIFIEVQLGSYFGEDDIIRVEDKYGRK